MLDEAKLLAQDGIPSVYSLIDLLNNEEDIINFIKFDTRTFLEPSEALFPQLNEESNAKEILPSHYKKATPQDKRFKINFDEILKENKEIAKRFKQKTENDRYNRMLASRRKLPAWKKKNEILNAIEKSQVI